MQKVIPAGGPVSAGTVEKDSSKHYLHSLGCNPFALALFFGDHDFNFAFEGSKKMQQMIHELEVHIDDYLTEQMMQLSETLKSWLRAEVTRQLSEKQ